MQERWGTSALWPLSKDIEGVDLWRKRKEEDE